MDESDGVTKVFCRSYAERGLAAAIAGLPLLYLLTDRSWSPVLWNYSVTLLIAIAVYGAFYALLLASYRWPLPHLAVRVRTYAIALGFAVIAALLSIEVILAVRDDRPDVEKIRLRGYAPDPDTGYVHLSNYEQQIANLESSGLWRTNSLGLRADRDYGPKPEGIVRILALGDSFTVNTAVALEDTWVGVLERRLNEASAGTGNYEVINAGHAGYGTLQTSSWYEKFGGSLESDLVLLAMTPNDITDNGSEPPGALTAVDGYLAYRGSAKTARKIWEHRRRWYSFAGYVLRSRVWSLTVKAWQLDREGPKLVACHERLDEREQRLHELTEGYLLKIRDQARAQGASFGLVIFTFIEQLGEMAPGYSPAIFGERWSRFAHEHEIPVIDTYPVLRSHPGEPALFWRWDHHYTEESSRIAGEAALELVAPMLSETLN